MTKTPASDTVYQVKLKTRRSQVKLKTPVSQVKLKTPSSQVKLKSPFSRHLRNKPEAVKGAYLLDKNNVYVCGLRYRKCSEHIAIMRGVKAKLEKEEIVPLKSATIKYLKSAMEAEDV